jgi:hypothetical protein
MLPHLRPGGVFLCEDVHGFFNGFSAYAQGLADNLHAYATPPDQAGTGEQFDAVPARRPLDSHLPVRYRHRTGR